MRRTANPLFGLFIVLSLGVPVRASDPSTTPDRSQFGRFVGTSPCNDAMRSLLKIPDGVEAEVIRWELTLLRDPQTLAPTRYRLTGAYGPMTTGLTEPARTRVELEGAWRLGKGTKANAEAVTVELDGAFALARVGEDLLHVLTPERALMVGTAGFSFTLNRADVAEKPGDRALAMSRQSTSYTIAPAATGPEVFAVFEGRTPGQRIMRMLNLPEDRGVIKAKWRVTLYQDPKTSAPTTYKAEGSLFRQNVRQGTWSIVHGTRTDPSAVVYRLDAGPTQGTIRLMKGDEGVVFFVDDEGRPLVGHDEFSYTLHRRTAKAE